MTITINKLSNTELQIRNGTNEEYIKEKIKEHNRIINEFDGFWFDIFDYDIFGNFFNGYNEITEKNEGYINLFLFDKIIDLNIIERLSEFKTKYQCSKIYLQLISNKSRELTSTISKKFNISSLIINKDLSSNVITEYPVSRDLIIRPPKLCEADLIVGCLVRAYINGTPPSTYKFIGLEKFKENIKEYYTPIIDDERIILVAEYEGRFCGHISYTKEGIFSGKYKASLIDIYILDEFSNLGIEKKLIAAGESYCSRLGFNKLSGTIEVYDNRRKNSNINSALNILGKLEVEGWDLETLILTI